MRSVLIVDDHPSFRASARRMLEAEGYDVVGEAGDGAGAVAAVRSTRPGLVLLDVGLPDMDGFTVAALLADEPDPPAVVLISSRDEHDFGAHSNQGAVRGFIAKAQLSGRTLERLL